MIITRRSLFAVLAGGAATPLAPLLPPAATAHPWIVGPNGPMLYVPMYEAVKEATIRAVDVMRRAASEHAGGNENPPWL